MRLLLFSTNCVRLGLMKGCGCVLEQIIFHRWLSGTPFVLSRNTETPESSTRMLFAVEPFLLKMSTVVVASNNPLQGGKAIVNKHIVKTSRQVKTSGQVKTPSGFFNSVLYTDTQPHGGKVTRYVDIIS